MTERVFQAESHLQSLTATVLSCTAASAGFDLVLDRTILFPEEGGQPRDCGTIDEQPVLAIDDRGDEILYRVEKAVQEGSRVVMTLDWTRRFDFMQQHTGEHLLSYAAWKRFGAMNVGFHLAETYATLDLDLPLSSEQVKEMEAFANELGARDLAVAATIYESEEQLSGLPLRKHAEGLTAPIRIVRIEDADCCTCCAPHCAHTGEVGQMKIIDAVAYKGGVRITFLCGGRALCHAVQMHDTVDGLARRFSTGREQVTEAVAKLQSDCNQLRRREKELVAQLNGFVSDALQKNAVTVGKYRLILSLLEDVDAGRLKALAQSALTADTLAVLFCKDGEKLCYIVALGNKLPLDAGDLIQAVNAACAGKGGGRGALAQGQSQSNSGAAETVEQLRNYFTARLKAGK